MVLLQLMLAVAAYAAVPLTEMSYDVHVAGPLAEVVVTQRFVNDGAEHLEAVYVFPLQNDASVDAVTLKIDERVIEAEVRERAEARAIYEDSVAQGFLAALTEQDRPNVFTQHVGNIPPGATIDVELHVMQPVPRQDGAYELVLPLTVAPRFDPVGLHPATASAAGTGIAIPVKLDLQIEAGLPLHRVESPTHPLQTLVSGSRTEVRGQDIVADRDLVVRWWVSDDAPQIGLLEQGGHLMLVFEPPQRMAFEERVPREILWVIDRSCSMQRTGIASARRIMHGALDAMDERDSFNIVTFSSHFEWMSPTSVEVDDAGRKQGHDYINGIYASGGTYLLEAIRFATRLPPDPTRQRYIAYITDGRIGNDNAVVAEVARNPDVRMFTFGVSSSPNRHVLDEMARAGRGRASYLMPSEAPHEATSRFVRALDRPVLTDIEVDWGEWEVHHVYPERVPDLYEGRPQRVVARISAGGGPVRVHGLVAGGRFTQVIHPTTLDTGRTVGVRWARDRIADLERSQRDRLVPEIRDEIVRTSLEYGVLSQYTSFIAVEQRVREAGEPLRWVQQAPAAPDEATVEIAALNTRPAPGRSAPRTPATPGAPEAPRAPVTTTTSGSFTVTRRVGGASSEEVVIRAKQKAVDTTSTTRGEVLTKEFLNRIPAGRSYQSAVGVVSGVTGGANPNMAGSAYNENSFMLDGANVTDPIAGTFSVNFNYDALQQIEVLMGGLQAESIAPLTQLVSQSGTNNLRLRSQAFQNVGDPEAADLGEGDLALDLSTLVSGPVVRDRTWLLLSHGFQRTRLENDVGLRAFDGHNLFGKLTAQPNAEHRFSAMALGDYATVTNSMLLAHLQDPRQVQIGQVGQARWQWFVSPDVNIDTQVSGLLRHFEVSEAEQPWGTDDRSRIGASTRLSLLGVHDPFHGSHDFTFGLEGYEVGWTPSLPTAATAARGSHLGLFGQDSWRPMSNVTVLPGARVDLTSLDGAAQTALVSPRFATSWDPFRDQRTKLAAAYMHVHKVDQLLLANVAGTALPDTEELLALAEREVVRDLALGWSGRMLRRNLLFLPVGSVQDGDLLPMTHGDMDVSLTKVDSRRWAARLTYTRAFAPLDAAGVNDPRAPFVPQFLSAYRPHAVSAWAYWDLPTDPYTQQIGLVVDWESAVDLDQAVASPWLGEQWHVAAQLAQTIDVRKGDVKVTGAAHWQRNQLPQYDQELVVAEHHYFDGSDRDPFRVEMGLSYGF